MLWKLTVAVAMVHNLMKPVAFCLCIKWINVALEQKYKIRKKTSRIKYYEPWIKTKLTLNHVLYLIKKIRKPSIIYIYITLFFYVFHRNFSKNVVFTVYYLRAMTWNLINIMCVDFVLKLILTVNFKTDYIICTYFLFFFRYSLWYLVFIIYRVLCKVWCKVNPDFIINYDNKLLYYTVVRCCVLLFLSRKKKSNSAIITHWIVLIRLSWKKTKTV